MNALELDIVYTRLCNQMSSVGEHDAPLFLSRFALLAITRALDAPTALALIDDAANGIGQFEASIVAPERPDFSRQSQRTRPA